MFWYFNVSMYTVVKNKVFSSYVVVDDLTVNTACKEYSWTSSWNFYKHSRHQVWQSVYLIGRKYTKTIWFYLHSKCACSHYLLFSAVFMFFTALLLFVCFLPCNLVIQAEFISSFQHYSHHMAVSVWQQHVHMWQFWTKSLILHLVRALSCISLFAKLITLNTALLNIFLVFLEVWPFSVLCIKLCDMNCQLYYLTVITWHLFSTLLSFIFSLPFSLSPVVHPL